MRQGSGRCSGNFTQRKHASNRIMEAVNGYQKSFTATETKLKAGFVNQIELEEQRRNLLLIQTTALENLKQRNLAG